MVSRIEMVDEGLVSKKLTDNQDLFTVTSEEHNAGDERAFRGIHFSVYAHLLDSLHRDVRLLAVSRD